MSEKNPNNCFDCITSEEHRHLSWKEMVEVCRGCAELHTFTITEGDAEGDFDPMADDAHDEFAMQETLRRGG